MLTVTVQQLRTALVEGGATVIDVREPEEFAGGHVPGARLAPLMTVPTIVDELPVDTPVFVICHSGVRSAHAAIFLERNGLDARNVEGGTADWMAAGYPLER